MPESTVKRVEWKFFFTKAELVSAVEARIDWHTRRLEHWEQECRVAERDLRENGINVQDVIDLANRQSGSTYGSPVAMLDVEKTKRFRDATSKKEEHTEKLDDFNRWHFAISHSNEPNFPLTINDVEYFHLDTLSS